MAIPCSSLFPYTTLFRSIVGVVGESGSGKSVTALSIMQLFHDTPGRISGGEVLYEGENLLDLSERDMRKIRGKEISMIFQDPMTSLNPVLRIGRQMREVLQLHLNMSKEEADRKSVV